MLVPSKFCSQDHFVLEYDFHFDVRLIPRNTKKGKKQIEIYCGTKVKGTVPQDFRIKVLFMNQFSQAPEYPIRVVPKFRDIHSSRCTTGVVDNGGKWEKFKIFNMDTFGW
jgi:hypothetical protein